MGDFSIVDLYIKDIEQQGSRLAILSASDPLLRRFGQADFISLAAGEELVIQREQADEVWAILSGESTLQLEDMREVSPSRGRRDQITLSGSTPRLVLVPFGVRLTVDGGPAAFLRLTTHEDDAVDGDLIQVP
jgi:hypothetical protein